MSRVETREYDRTQSVVFRKTSERYGGLSNMAPGFPLRVNGVRVRTAEALYQACRFPHLPDVQRLIIEEGSPMAAKMRSKPFRSQTRSDWEAVRSRVMRWCLRVKLAQNWESFGGLLKATGDRPIVEESKKDDFWGAHPRDDGGLVGANVLGRLLMELRHQLLGPQSDELRTISPLQIPDFLLYAEAIQEITSAAQPSNDASKPEPGGALSVPGQGSLLADDQSLSHSKNVTGSPVVVPDEASVARYLNADEVARLRSLGIDLSKTALTFGKHLDESQLRTVWQVVAAISRRRPRSEDWVNWLVGDWANETDGKLGDGAAKRIIDEETQVYLCSQHQLRLAGGTLFALQFTELAIATCVRLLQPPQGSVNAADLLSEHDTKRQRTLGQLNALLKERKLFVDQFEQRMDRFVRRRNEFVHRLWAERQIDFGSAHPLRMAALHELESFMQELLREAYDIGRVFKGFFAAIGVTIAERENVETIDRWLEGWSADLERFIDVQRRE